MLDLDAVLFDMDGVLCHLRDDSRIGFLAERTGRTPEEIRRAIWGSGFEDRADAGEFTADDYLRQFGERLGSPLARTDWIAYRRVGTVPIPDALVIAAAVAQRYRCGVLTNNGHLLVEEIDGIFPELRPIFGERIWCSAQFGCRKPDPSIFLQACERLGSEPARTLLIDDRPENVQGAIEAGLLGHLSTPEVPVPPSLRLSG